MNIIKIVGKTLNVHSKRRIKKFILKHIYFDRLVDTYDSWIIKNFPDALEILHEKEKIKTFSYQPLISITVPTYNTPAEFLHECIRSVLVQSYENWELVLVDDASPESTAREIIKEYAAKDARIKYAFLKKNHHIAGATNEAIKLSTGEFVGLFDHDDILWPNALYEVVKALNEERDIDFIYTDEDKIIETKSRHAEPFFKPDWSPALLQTCNYITHFSVFRRDLLDKVGYEDGAYNGAQDWEMIMRATRNAAKIHHIPKIVYSWRVHDNSTAKTMESKPYVIAAQQSAIASAMHAAGYNEGEFTIAPDKKYFSFWNATIHTIGEPKVSIVVLDQRQLRHIAGRTTYTNTEFIVAQSFQEGLKRSTGEYVAFFEPTIRITSKRWVETLLNGASQPQTGVVGGLTTYGNTDYIYSAGATINQDGKFVRILSGGVDRFNLKTLTRTLYVYARRNTTSVTGAVMVKKDRLAGYSFRTGTPTEQLLYLGADLIEKGLYNIYDPEFLIRVPEHYHEQKKQVNKDRKSSYADREVGITLPADKFPLASKNRYFHDDLVSYPDNDVL